MKSKLSKKNQRLAALLRATSGTIRVEDAVNALDLNRTHASKLLASWHRQGALRRVAHGLYVPIQPSAIEQTQVLEDPWVLVPELYKPAYIGGWSALEYWGLTEQLFRSVCVLTSKRCPKGEMAYQGVNFFIKHISEKQIFGTKTIWRENSKIQISDPYKTILDVLDDPYLGAGLQHSEDCLCEFRRVFSKEIDLETLFDYALSINNGALFKKLGYLTEKHGFERAFVERCHQKITKGLAYLDKRADNNRLVTKWNLWVPEGN